MALGRRTTPRSRPARRRAPASAERRQARVGGWSRRGRVGCGGQKPHCVIVLEPVFEADMPFCHPRWPWAANDRHDDDNRYQVPYEDTMVVPSSGRRAGIGRFGDGRAAVTGGGGGV